MERYNNEFLVRATDTDIAKWMLEKNMEFTTGDPKGERSDSLHLRDFVRQANTNIGEKIFSANIIALENWNPETCNEESLRNLAYFAALTENQKAVPSLIKLIDQNQVPEDKEGEETRTKSIVMAVIAGFSKNEEAAIALKKWFEDESTSWMYTAIIFNGVTEAYPENAETFFPKALQIFDEHSDFFVLGYVAAALEDTLGSERVKKILSGFKNLSAREMEKMLN
jgi:uncharacterized protein YhaN